MDSTGITIRIAAVDLATNRLRAVAAEARMLPSHFSQAGAALRNFGIRIALPAVAIRQFAKSCADAVRWMSALSDRAADAGVSSAWMQKMAGAMKEVGVRGASFEMLAQSMQHMTRATGEIGEAGFAKVLGTAAKIGNEAERLDFLTKAFGRTAGASFAAIVRGGDEAMAKLLQTAGTYPAVGDASVNAADRAADALTRASDAIKAGWGELVANLVQWIEGSFGPLPEIAEAIAQGIMKTFKRVGDFFRALILGIRVLLEPIVRTFTVIIGAVPRLAQALTNSSYSFRDAFREIGQDASVEFGEMIEQWNEIAEHINDNSNIGATKEVKPIFTRMKAAFAEGGATLRENISSTAKGLVSDISNAFSKGGTFALQGSNEARKIIMGDPWKGGAAQSQRTVTQYLPRVASGVERMVSRLGDMVSTFDELEAI